MRRGILLFISVSIARLATLLASSFSFADFVSEPKRVKEQAELRPPLTSSRCKVTLFNEPRSGQIGSAHIVVCAAYETVVFTSSHLPDGHEDDPEYHHRCTDEPECFRSK